MALRVAIVGCGKIADAHAAQIQRLPRCEIVGVCDREELMARQLAERFRIARYFESVTQLLESVAPDVVHITTPPSSHFAIARESLLQGCHLYVEKPFTLNAGEADELVRLADARDAKLTVGHDAQFSPVARRMRALIDQGYLGNSVVHMESYYGYDLGDERYARVFLRDGNHWVRTLPGGLLQNVISHGIAQIAPFLRAEHPRVLALGFVSPFLSRLGEQAVLDELRVIIVDDIGTTAYFTFSSQMRPLVHQFRIFGSRNGLFLDEDNQTLLRLRGTAFKSYVERFAPPLLFARQYLANLGQNARLFLANEFHMEAGKKELIAAFYRSILDGTPVPIPYEEILMTAKVMDSIFAELANGSQATSRREADVW
jgi:predicted dehydrogenase